MKEQRTLYPKEYMEETVPPDIPELTRHFYILPPVCLEKNSLVEKAELKMTGAPSQKLLKGLMADDCPVKEELNPAFALKRIVDSVKKEKEKLQKMEQQSLDVLPIFLGSKEESLVAKGAEFEASLGPLSNELKTLRGDIVAWEICLSEGSVSEEHVQAAKQRLEDAKGSVEVNSVLLKKVRALV